MRTKERNSNKARRWFVTGATGFIGREFVGERTRRASNRDKIAVLVRPGSKVGVLQRFRASMQDLLPLEKVSGFRVVKGDITKKQLGLGAQWCAPIQSIELAGTRTGAKGFWQPYLLILENQMQARSRRQVNK